MKTQILKMIHTVGIWLFFCIMSFLVSRIAGTSGSQLQKALKMLKRLEEKNENAEKRLKENKYTNIKKSGIVERLLVYSRSISKKVRLFIFDNKENQRIQNIKDQVEEICLMYKGLLKSIFKKNNTEAQLSVLSQMPEYIKRVEKSIEEELSLS